MASGGSKYLDLTHEFEELTEIGDLVVANGRMQLHLFTAGVEKRLSTTTCSVWVQSSGQWQLRAFIDSSAG
ncbi:nuclear transport factor 2 family protein [Glutamicibacter arilaitensis]